MYSSHRKTNLRSPISAVIVTLWVLLLITAGTAWGSKKPPGKFETIRVQAAGYQGTLEGYRDEADNFLIPLIAPKTTSFLQQFQCTPTYLAPLETIVLGFPGKRDLRLKPGSTTAELGSQTFTLKTAPLVKNGEAYIPLEAVERALGMRSMFDPVTGKYYFDTLITSVNLESEYGQFKLVIKSAAPVKFTTTVLEDPRRYAIDIDEALLDESIVNKDIQDPRIGNISILQESLNPNRVRILVPLDKEIGIETLVSPEDPCLLIGRIFTKEVIVPGDYKQERISDLRVEELSDRVILKILTTGPVQYDWRRLPPPDNRYYVDIPNCLFTAPTFERTFDVGYLESIRVEQHKLAPEPVVRITMKLHVPSRITLGPDRRYPGELHVSIFSQTINPMRVARQGQGVTEAVESTPAVNRGVTIVLDPGHGGGDPGAVNTTFGITEKFLNLDISLRLAKLLREAGWNVILTRTSDRDVTYAGSPDGLELQSRVDVARRANAQLFVSIHNNACVTGRGQGTSVYYYKNDSFDLARHINTFLVNENRRHNEGVLQGSFHVIRTNPIPAVLIECAYVSNHTEAALLTTPEFRQKCAVGIFKGLMAYARAKNLKGLKHEVQTEPTESEAEKLKRKKLEEMEKTLRESNPAGCSEYRER